MSCHYYITLDSVPYLLNFSDINGFKNPLTPSPFLIFHNCLTGSGSPNGTYCQL